MNAKAWFNSGLDAQSEALRAETTEERQRHGRNAIDAFLAAASLGYPDAFLAVGTCYQHGAFGVLPARLDLAEHWLRLAATAENATGMLALATLLIDTGRKREGRKWLRKALAYGEGGAACHLGRELEAQSPSQALHYYLRGIELGDPFAAMCAGNLLETRKTRRSLLQAEALYKKAVRKELRGADEALERVRRLLNRPGPRSHRRGRPSPEAS